MLIKKKAIIISVTVIVSIIAFNAPKIIDLIIRRPLLVKYFPFSEENDLAEWEEKIFKGKVTYRIDKDNQESFVFGSSEDSASALYYKIKLKIKKRPFISWKWNVQKFPEKASAEKIEDIQQDDFAARVYVIFPKFSFSNSKALEYIWAQNLPEGTIGTSPLSKNLKLIVVQSGKAEEGGWVSEYRDVCEDYVKAFGEKPRINIGAIAFMTDSDATESTAESLYDDIKIGYKEGGAE